MASPFHLSVLTPEKQIFDADVTYLEAPGMDGYLGVLAHHAPLITALVPGKLVLRDLHNMDKAYAISGGFLEVSNNDAVILADAMESLDEIDLGRAQSAERRARERLGKVSDASIDAARADAALKRAVNRIKLAQSRR